MVVKPVNHRLGRCQGGAVEGREPSDDGVDEGIQFGVGQGAGNPAPPLLGGGCVVVCAGENDLQRPVTTDGPRKPLRAPPPPGSRPLPTSGCPKIAFSRLA